MSRFANVKTKFWKIRRSKIGKTFMIYFSYLLAAFPFSGIFSVGKIGIGFDGVDLRDNCDSLGIDMSNFVELTF